MPMFFRCFAVLVQACLLAALAGPAMPWDSSFAVNVVNKTGKTLNFLEVKNEQAIKLDDPPPDTIANGETGVLRVEWGSSEQNVHLNIKYTIGDTDETVGIVYKHLEFHNDHCPKEHPDWITETVTHCGNSSGEWTYLYEAVAQ